MPGEAEGAVILHAGCKINAFLKITGRRADGYHLLESLFLPLASPRDTLTVTRVSGEGIRFACSDEALATPRNIVVKAYEAFANATTFAPGLSVFLHKEIPYGAGLGGGSADAAAMLRHLAYLAAQAGVAHPGNEGLTALAARLGADVPFFLSNSPALVRGIGEIVSPVANPFSGLHLVLVCPFVSIATAWAFAAWDKKNEGKQYQRALTKAGEEDTSPFVRGVCIRNDLSEVVFATHPEVAEIVEQLCTMRAAAASMSGSGSSVYGIFADNADAEAAACFFHNRALRVFRHTM